MEKMLLANGHPTNLIYMSCLTKDPKLCIGRKKRPRTSSMSLFIQEMSLKS
jgi:hypothetical protein